MRTELTPHGKIAPGLLYLLEAMEAIGIPFNAMLTPAGPDVSTLALVDNGVGWEAVCEPCYADSIASYDLWFRGELKYMNVTLDDAAHFLIARYQEAKINRAAKE